MKIWPFKRRRNRSAASPTDASGEVSHLRAVLDGDTMAPIAHRSDSGRHPSLTDPMRPAASPAGPMRPGIGLLKFIPFEKAFTGLFSLLRDPNGKISSKRAGAGALVTAGIAMLLSAQDGWRFAGGCVCVAAAVVLFYFTKLETPE